MSKPAAGDGQISAVEQLLAVAEALEREAAARYRSMAARLARQGEAATAAQFETLAALEDRHVGDVADRARSLLGGAAPPLQVGWELPVAYDEDEARGAELGVYQALAFAVRNEERAFAFYAYAAAATDDDAVRALAEALARDELDHAAMLRRHRRRAFHADRPATIDIPTSVEALQAAARAWSAEAAAAHAELAARLDAEGEKDDAAIFRRLAADEKASAGDAAASAVPPLRDAEAGLRLLEASFDRYAVIAERARDEAVVAAAQRLESEAIARLAMAGGARRNALLPASR